MTIRDARPSEAAALTRLAKSAKASWGYPDEWLDAWEDDLTFSPELVESGNVYVAESKGEICGVIGIERGPDGPEISHLWIEPSAQGKGVGRSLMDFALQFAQDNGWGALCVESDPFARPFYEKMGAVWIGDRDAPVAGTPRSLPILRFDIPEIS